MAIWLSLIVLVILLLGVIAIYNGLIRLKNQVDNALAQIDVQLKRRHDLIPNMVAIAKGYMGHENATLLMVTTARNTAKATHTAGLTSDNGTALQSLAGAENALSKALGQFYVVVESYPELKADAIMQQALDELVNTENRIGFARQHYNDSVMYYNNQREVFPNNVLSGFFGFGRLAQLQFQDKSQLETAPQVQF